MKIMNIKKSFKCIKIAALAIAIAIASGNCVALQVTAGSGDIVVDNESFAKELDSTKWNALNADDVVQKGKLLFGKNSTGETRIITKLAANKSPQHKELFHADYSMKINTLPKGEKFILGFSLAGVESYYGEQGNVELVLENNNGVVARLIGYDDAGKEVELAEASNCGLSVGKTFNVNVHASADMKLSVTVNSKKIYDATCPIDLQGRIGFLQTGKCAVEVSSVEIISHKYDAPENVNIIEDFESGGININATTSKMSNGTGSFPAGVQVEDYKGSKVLMFRNANLAYFGTVYPYSNFEITFDIPYMLHKNVTREDGTIRTPYHMAFMLTIGDESEDYDDYGYETAAEGISFASSEISFLKGNSDKVFFDGKTFYDEKENEGYSVRVTVIDSWVTVEIKPLDGNKYTKMASYKLGDATPLGYVHLWSTGQANFAIDNLRIINKDKGANVKEVEYQTRTLEGIEDWKYEPMEVKYLKTEEESNDFQWERLMVYAAITGVLFIAICAVIAKIQKTPKKKEEKTDEQV